MPLYSHSRLRVYETCPRQYRFRYLDRIKLPRVKTAEMFRGTQVHAALEALYRRVQRGRMPSLEEIVDGYRRAWQAEWAPEILISDPSMTPEDFLRQGEQDLVTYDARYRPFDGDRTVEVESRITLSLDPARRISLQGYVDRLSIARDGVWRVHDYKTARRLPAQQELDEDRQLALYQIGVQRRYPLLTERVELIWHYLAFDQEMRSSRSPAALLELEGRTLALIDVIQADTAFETRVGHHCRSCTYQPMCPAWSHQFRQAALPEPERVLEPGAVLVDRLAELRQQKRALARQMDLTEADLLEYSRREGVETVFGATHKATISEEETVAFPTPADPKRGQAEEVIRQAGRWDEVVMLDVRAAVRLYRSGVWPEYFRRILAPFLNTINRFRIGLRKR
jgi:putative RecB family exonuclease